MAWWPSNTATYSLLVAILAPHLVDSLISCPKKNSRWPKALLLRPKMVERNLNFTPPDGGWPPASLVTCLSWHSTHPLSAECLWSRPVAHFLRAREAASPASCVCSGIAPSPGVSVRENAQPNAEKAKPSWPPKISKLIASQEGLPLLKRTVLTSSKDNSKPQVPWACPNPLTLNPIHKVSHVVTPNPHYH